MALANQIYVQGINCLCVSHFWLCHIVVCFGQMLFRPMLAECTQHIRSGTLNELRSKLNTIQYNKKKRRKKKRIDPMPILFISLLVHCSCLFPIWPGYRFPLSFSSLSLRLLEPQYFCFVQIAQVTGNNHPSWEYV